jgi:hypothetical protein
VYQETHPLFPELTAEEFEAVRPMRDDLLVELLPPPSIWEQTLQVVGKVLRGAGGKYNGRRVWWTSAKSPGNSIACAMSDVKFASEFLCEGKLYFIVPLANVLVVETPEETCPLSPQA